MSYESYRPQPFKILPDVVKNLLIINVLFFAATYFLEAKFGYDLNDKFGLHYFGSEKFRPVQLITYMFLHGSIQHIFFNMFALWMFGNAIENYWGAKRFLLFYIVCGIGAALTHYTIFYFQSREVVDVFTAYANHPDAESFKELIENFVSTNSTLEFQESYANFSQEYNSLLQTNPQQAMSMSVDFVSKIETDSQFDLPRIQRARSQRS